MKRIAYLLHHFPRTTDTFIKREIRSLQKLGTEVQSHFHMEAKGARNYAGYS